MSWWIVIPVVVVVLLLGAVGWAWRHPVDLFIIQSRRALRKAGLERRILRDAGFPMVYWVGGSGDPLLLIHGVNDQAGTWSSVVPELVPRFRVIVPDLPGHGESGPADGVLSLPSLVEALHQLLKQESPDEPVVVVGNSLGGWLAQLLALRNPKRIRRLVLEAAGGLQFDYGRVRLAPETREEALDVSRAVFGPDTPLPPRNVLDNMVRRARTAPIRRIATDDLGHHLLEGRLRGIDVPVLLVWGESDGILSRDYAERLLSEYPRAELRTIPGAGHIPHREKPREFLEAMGLRMQGWRPEPVGSGKNEAQEPR